MKLILYLTLLLFTSVCNTQEIVVDSINYRAFTVLLSEPGLKKGDGSDVLFSFRGDKIKTSIKGQQRAFYIKKDWVDDTILESPVKIAECIDDGGFQMVITIGLDLKSQTHFIMISYNNKDWFYEVKEEAILIQDY